MEKMRKYMYKNLSQRIERERKMFVISQKIQTRKDIQVRNGLKLKLTLCVCWFV